MTVSPRHPTNFVIAVGPRPFITKWVCDDRRQAWSSRHHRKGLSIRAVRREERLAVSLLNCLWMPQQLNWWIGVIFALGALLFLSASLLSLLPGLAASWSLHAAHVNAVFFAGSIPFTTAAFLQLSQAAQATRVETNQLKLPSSRALLGWRPEDIGWLSCALQFVGTILFNLNTFDAMLPSLHGFQRDLLVWVPNAIGSVLFLSSGYLAFMETCHAHWAWQPRKLAWWIVFLNLLGCVGFMASAVCAINLPGVTLHTSITMATVFTMLGAMGFLVGALLMLPEAYLRRPVTQAV